MTAFMPARRKRRQDFVFPSEPQGRYTIGLFVRKDDPWRLRPKRESLKGQEIAGLIIDYGLWR